MPIQPRPSLERRIREAATARAVALDFLQKTSAMTMAACFAEYCRRKTWMPAPNTSKRILARIRDEVKIARRAARAMGDTK